MHSAPKSSDGACTGRTAGCSFCCSLEADSCQGWPVARRACIPGGREQNVCRPARGGKRQPTLSVIFALARELKLTPEALVQKVRKLAAERSEQA